MTGPRRAPTLASERKPETLSQAHAWEKAKRSYLLAGLCDRCAAQAAWAHQTGWAVLTELPCPGCAGLVAALPVATTNDAWRRFSSGRPDKDEVAIFRAQNAPRETALALQGAS